METCVLIPKEFSLASRSVRDRNRNHSGDADIWVVSNCSIPQGTRIYPFQGTVRIDHLDVFSYINPSDIRHRFGLYDELLSPIATCKVRYCNWIRFLRYTNQYTPEVNIVASKLKGEPLYEVVRPIAPDKELVAYFLPDSPEDEFLLPAVHYLRYSLYRRTMATVMEAAPLDLSMSLVSRRGSPMSPSSDLDEMKSISSDTASSSGGDLENLTSRVSRKFREKHLLPCEVCGKGFDRPSLLKRHMRTHTGEKPHVCDVCGKGFSTSSSLNTHRRIHSGEKPHQCGVCGKRFTASSNLYYHRMTHIKEKPHKCHLCSKSFPTPGDLKSHMYVHNGSWPYKCHICNRGFSKHTNLKNHLFLHTGDKPHVCELCKKRFALACNLRAHLKTHEGEHQDACAQCGNTSNLMEAGGVCKECYVGQHGLSLVKDTKPKLNHSIESLVLKDKKLEDSLSS